MCAIWCVRVGSSLQIDGSYFTSADDLIYSWLCVSLFQFCSLFRLTVVKLNISGKNRLQVTVSLDLRAP